MGGFREAKIAYRAYLRVGLNSGSSDSNDFRARELRAVAYMLDLVGGKVTWSGSYQVAQATAWRAMLVWGEVRVAVGGFPKPS